MGLGLKNGGGAGGQYLPIIKYDARSGRMFRVDRTQGANGWESTSVDITNELPTFALDFRSIEVGWAAFLSTGPSFEMAPLGQPSPASPSKEHKQAFRVKVYGPKQLGGVREFSSSSKAVISAIERLHNTYEASPEGRAGQIPVVKMTHTLPAKSTGPSGTTTNYAPVFEIVQWVDRPAELGDATVPLPSDAQLAPQPAAPTAPSAPPPGHVPPPSAAAAVGADASPLPF